MSSSKDVPVFLPYRCPNVDYRFVACMLIPHVQVCCLCGSTPLIEDIEYSASQCFKSALEVIEMALRCHPRNLPNSIQLESEFSSWKICGFTKSKCIFNAVLSLINSESDESKSGKPETNTNSDKLKRGDKLNGQLSRKDVITVYKETYWCSEYYKCHALISDSNIE